MKEKDKWIKNFRTRMEGYSEPAPADLWEQLEKELDTVPKVIPMLAPLAGCSSCCLVSGCVFIDRMVLAVTFCKLFGETVGRVECNARTR